jgi:predicted membrane channel-forming protein YqfA (hemolysin III family)
MEIKFWSRVVAIFFRNKWKEICDFCDFGNSIFLAIVIWGAIFTYIGVSGYVLKLIFSKHFGDFDVSLIGCSFFLFSIIAALICLCIYKTVMWIADNVKTAIKEARHELAGESENGK